MRSPRGDGYSLIWPIGGRAAGFWIEHDCPKQGPKLEGVVLNRAGQFRGLFVLNRIRVSDRSTALLHPNMGHVPPPCGRGVGGEEFVFAFETVFVRVFDRFSVGHRRKRMET